MENQETSKRKVISRIDGPIAAIRHNEQSKIFDDAVYKFCDLVSDGMIVQSEWSMAQIRAHPTSPNCPHAIIEILLIMIFYPFLLSPKGALGKT